MRVEIAAIDPAGRDRVVLRLSDGARVTMSRAACVRLGLVPGGAVDGAALVAAAAAEAAELTALRLLTLRARSRADLQRRLERRFPEAAVAAAMARVGAYLDDEAFARQWVAVQLSRKPRGRAALLAELRRQGVRAGAAEAAVAGLDETELIAAAAATVLRRLRGQPPDVVARRLAAALTRRGFGAAAVGRVLRERCGDDANISWTRGGSGDPDEG